MEFSSKNPKVVGVISGAVDFFLCPKIFEENFTSRAATVDPKDGRLVTWVKDGR